MIRAVILGTGSCLPARTLTNLELEQMVETSDEWITTRTGIRNRHIAAAGEQTYQLAAKAARRALAVTGIDPEELDLIIVATISPHMIMPSTACFVQAELGAVNAFAYDINAACAGFTYGLDLASNYIQNRADMKILLIGAETLSARVNWQDRNTCVLFGDGAGAVIVSGSSDGRGIFGSNLKADGKLWNLLFMDSPESLNPDLQRQDWQGAHIQMNGSDIFKHAVRLMEDAVKTLLRKTKTAIEDISLMIPHQANIRILNNLKERLGISEEKIFINLSQYGNTSAASIPIALDEAHRQGRLVRGDIVLLCTFGGGLTWGSLLMRW
ncbi:beta-ketoacyl-ACP synthase III [Desulfobulbus oligotrophicus]|jgi:3-oxoacyl-[acyl-carrier-protein] synthase-3|uniref:Beta-ketoacyl-[acyl-carrier-protein] synthase III n=1 Tax=Desulfobulbus oligotrophicus TaxID=1909699 RepID=A0A7T6AR60_9BACT|nr:beta-ketoacyl-ACP synthase III [Desulfobulbus oligotrophicus]MDY0389829.1 beta-ketoacyl-ACP synthase III [Desulfobulbus oligotrophicus]QQG66533.1 ketoacyl-ACP synthase III [Desulfobulbus oligotrophicus]